MITIPFNAPDFLVAAEMLRQVEKDGIVLDPADAVLLARVAARDTAGIDFGDFTDAIARTCGVISAFH